MNKQGIIDAVHEVIGGTKAGAEKAVDVVIESIVSSLKKSEEVSIAGLGIFSTKLRASCLFMRMICFDVASLDIVNYLIADDENYITYGQLIEAVNTAEPDILTKAKGFYADGELGLLKH